MALNKITYTDKVSLNPQPSVANENKCTADDLNEIKEATNGVVDMVKSNNLLIDKCFINAYITNAGAISSANNNALFGYIEVEPNTTYTMSVNTTINSMMIGEYDNSKTWLQRPLGNDVSKLTITTSANTKYVRVAINKDNSTAMTQSIIDSLEAQFEKGGDRTAYMSYVNIKGQDIYSKGEIQIGIWTDGKPLYRRVLTMDPLKNNGETKVYYDSTYIIQKFDVYVENPTSTVKFHLPIPSANYISTFVETNLHYISVQTSSDRTAFTNNYVIIEYTKTTD